MDGEEFPGGKADDFNLVLGSGQFIPGFEDQLIGVKAGEERELNVTFPADYPDAKLAGKDAVFTATVKEVKKPDPLKVDDELAKKLGLDSLATLKDRVRDQLKADFARASRMHLKRRILDALDEAHSFSRCRPQWSKASSTRSGGRRGRTAARRQDRGRRRQDGRGT